MSKDTLAANDETETRARPAWIKIAAALAVLGGLALLAREAGTRVLPGYLAALRSVVLEEEFIDHIPTPLLVHAQMIAALTDSFMYRFTISTESTALASARATVSARKVSTP